MPPQSLELRRQGSSQTLSGTISLHDAQPIAKLSAFTPRLAFSIDNTLNRIGIDHGIISFALVSSATDQTSDLPLQDKMSSTPRKKRQNQPNPSTHAHPNHQRTRSQHLATQAAVSANHITSDYESDTASYMATRPPPQNPGLALRSNTEINMTVLRRYIPSLTHIHSIASNAVVYTFESAGEAGGFEKANIEGPLFTCQLNGNESQNCVFILNRKSTDNLRLDLANVTNFEQQGDMLYMQIMGSDGEPRVWGLFIHDSSDNRRETHTNVILRMWHATKEARALQTQTVQRAHEAGGAAHVVPGLGGRQISINELLKR